MKRTIICLLHFFLVFFIYANDDLLSDYQRLYIDLQNINTYGYKSFFNPELNRSTDTINLSQGALIVTDINLDCAIAGEGFFKIRLENDMPGYTRNGNFDINADGFLVTPCGYPLYESICFGEYFIYENIKITMDHIIYIKSFEGEETAIGKILTYKIPVESLEYYKDSIYVIKEGSNFTEEITFDNTIFQGILELSNIYTDKVIIRMYYVLTLLNDKIIPNIEFKKELLRFQIERMARRNMLLENILLRINWKFNLIGNEMQNIGYIEAILPFIKYDY